MIRTETIEVAAADGGVFDAYVAIPPKGRGPALVILQEIFGVNDSLKRTAQRFAEEGYLVAVPDLFWRLERNVALGYSQEEVGKAFGLYQRFDQGLAVLDILDAAAALRNHPNSDGPVAVVGFCLGGTLALRVAAHPDIAAAVAYYPVAMQEMLDIVSDIRCPTVIHFGGQDQLCPPEALEEITSRCAENSHIQTFVYPDAGHAFFNEDRPEFNRHARNISHTRTLTVLKKEMGPHYDLSALWDQHAMLEFVARDPDGTIGTMVEEPYVNHVPTLTGGVGRRELYHFYKNYFCNINDENIRFIPVSRTVGVDRVVEEAVACFRHDRLMDYFLPGVPPTGRDVMLPMVGVISFRGDKLYHEHLYWDQACLLAQIGLLDTKDLPISGREQADKVLDEASVPSNAMMTTWKPPYAAATEE